MKKFPIRDLTTALNNPQEYRSKLDNKTNEPEIRGETYFGALRHSIFRYHDSGNNADYAISDLNSRLKLSKRLKNPIRKDETRDQLLWYIDDVLLSSLLTFQNRKSVRLILPNRVDNVLYCPGEICRIDMEPSIRHYTAWLIRSEGASDILSDISAPLIQKAVAHNCLNVSSDLVTVGVYSFKEEYVDLKRYTKKEILEAENDFDHLFTSMGY